MLFLSGVVTTPVSARFHRDAESDIDMHLTQTPASGLPQPLKVTSACLPRPSPARALRLAQKGSAPTSRSAASGARLHGRFARSVSMCCDSPVGLFQPVRDPVHGPLGPARSGQREVGHWLHGRGPGGRVGRGEWPECSTPAVLVRWRRWRCGCALGVLLAEGHEGVGQRGCDGGLQV